MARFRRDICSYAVLLSVILLCEVTVLRAGDEKNTTVTTTLAAKTTIEAAKNATSEETTTATTTATDESTVTTATTSATKNVTEATASTTPTTTKSSSFSVGSFFGGAVFGMAALVGAICAYKFWIHRRASQTGYRSY